MAFIQVYFNDIFLGEVPLREDPSDPVSIGRDPDSDIPIANAGVSALHAVIWKEGDGFVIADTASKNGVMVNGEITHRKVLAPGDTIKLLKYALKFETSGTGVVFSPEVEPNQIQQRTTVQVDLERLDGLVAKANGSAACLKVLRGSATPSELRLDKVNVKIGKAAYCDITIGGWLAPPLMASIVRRTDGYYLKPERRGRIRLNSEAVVESRKLSNGDRLIVRDCEMSFHEPQAALQSDAKA